MRAVLIDARGQAVPGSAVRHVIQREVAVAGGKWVERRDSRLLPGETTILELPWQGYAGARMWLEVRPDHYYDTKVYDALLTRFLPGSPSAELIGRADVAVRQSDYRLFETELRRPVSNSNPSVQ